MVDPLDIINYDRTDIELEEFLMFSIVVAGKTAATQSKALGRFFDYIPEAISPFYVIKTMLSENCLYHYVKQSRLGQYTKITKAFMELIEKNIDPRTCTLEELESVHGIGPKTARFFLLYTRPNQRYAVLDTHILKFIRDYLDLDVPRSTPSGKKYMELEDKFLEYVDTTGRSIPEVDLEIWTMYSKG